MRNYLAQEGSVKSIEDVFNEVTRHIPDVSFDQITERLQLRSDLFQFNGKEVSLRNVVQFRYYNLLRRLSMILKPLVKGDDLYLVGVYYLAFAKQSMSGIGGSISINGLSHFADTCLGNELSFDLKEHLNKVIDQLGVINIMKVLQLLYEYDIEFWMGMGGINTLSLIDEMNRVFGPQHSNQGFYSPEFIDYLASNFPENINDAYFNSPSAHQLAIRTRIDRPGCHITISEFDADNEITYRLLFIIAGINRISFIKGFPNQQKFDFAYIDLVSLAPLQTGRVNTIISEMLRRLKDNFSETLALITEGYLYTDQPVIASARLELLDNGSFYKIISLPEAVFRPATKIKTSLANMVNFENNKITFEYISDAAWTYFKDEGDIPLLQAETLRAVHDIYSIAARNNLSATRYCLPVVKVPGNAKTLREITNKVSRGYPIGEKTEHDHVPYLNITDLSDEDESIYLKSEGFSAFCTTDKQAGKKSRIAAKGSVLISVIGSNLKPTVMNLDRQVVISQNIACLDIKPKVVLPEYLALELKKKYVQDQINQLSYGTSINRLRRLDLESINIAVPPLNEQHKMIFDSMESSVKLDDSIIREVVGIIKHRLSTPVATVAMGLNNLMDFTLLHEKDSFTAETITHPYPEYLDEKEKQLFTFKNALNAVAVVADNMQNILKKLEHITRLDKEGMQTASIDFEHFMKRSILPVFNSTTVSVEYIALAARITADEKQLEFLILNLIENAVKHGKMDDQKLNIVIQLKEQEMTDEDTKKSIFRVLSVANDGKALPIGFQKDFFVKKFSKSSFSSGNGLGGYIVNKIVRNHNAELEILKQNEVTIPGMKVQFNINFPIE